MKMKKELSGKYTGRMASMDDLPRIHHLGEKKSLHYHGVPGFSLERLRNEYEIPGFDITKSVHLVEDRSGKLAGLVEVWDESNPPVHPYVRFSVDPDLENQGLEDYLLAWGQERSHQVLDRVDPGFRVSIRSSADQAVKSSGKAIQAAGMKYIRHSFQMQIEMADPPAAPVWPDGITMRLYNPDQDARTVYEVDEEAFQDHFGFVKEDPEEGFEKFMHHMAGDDSYDPSLWFLAVAGEEIIGICLCRRYGPEDRTTGYVSSLGVKRAWRRQGIALALLQQSFGEYYKRGKTKVDLGVDAESLTGATDLYKKAGMFVLRRYDMYEKELRSGKEVSVTGLETSEE
jgi:ribosomal protein S18 acetylase RimI-like enzyme